MHNCVVTNLSNQMHIMPLSNKDIGQSGTPDSNDHLAPIGTSEPIKSDSELHRRGESTRIRISENIAGANLEAQKTTLNISVLLAPEIGNLIEGLLNQYMPASERSTEKCTIGKKSVSRRLLADAWVWATLAIMQHRNPELDVKKELAIICNVACQTLVVAEKQEIEKGSIGAVELCNIRVVFDNSDNFFVQNDI